MEGLSNRLITARQEKGEKASDSDVESERTEQELNESARSVRLAG